MRAGAEMRPTLIAFARRPKSCGPDARRWRQGMERLCADRPQETTGSDQRSSEQLSPDGDEQSVSIATGESTKQAGSLTACGTPDLSGAPW
jgi:hypothetical protein